MNETYMISNFTIQRLPDNVINQIKAGEVIERPFNVVKELVENSLDAGASTIKIDLLDGGKRLIQIVDNGRGIVRECIPLAFERHTTSKLNVFEDLESIKSFGFRGEALASIASVAKISIKTKTQLDEIGHEIFFENGMPVNAQDCSMVTGTAISVKDIFYNVPARLKFLRSTGTEFALIQEFLTATSLAYPHVSFHFIHNGRNVFDYKAKTSRLDRFKEVMGMDASDYAIIDFERGGFALTGFAILPEKIRSSQNSFVTFVNGRFIKDRIVRAGIYAGYQGILMKGVTPSVMLFMQMDSKMLDINAHPSKIEVRFYDPILIQDFIGRGIENAVKTKLNENFHTKVSSEIPLCNQADRPVFSVEPLADYNRISARVPKIPENLQNISVNTSRSVKQGMYKHVSPKLFEQEASTNIFSNAKFLNQFAQCYLIFESASELWFIDQHAFHERILFEEIQTAHKKNKMAKQMLLNPVLVPINNLSTHIYEENAQLISELGFETEVLKDKHIAIHSMPTFLPQKYLTAVFNDITHQLTEEKILDVGTLYHHCFATIACHSAIRAGESLNADFVQKLVNRANDVDFFAHCPHGRPVMRKFSQNDVARWFERI